MYGVYPSCKNRYFVAAFHLMGKYAKAFLKSQERKYTDFGLMIADCVRRLRP
jgi:hypothetical protein